MIMSLCEFYVRVAITDVAIDYLACDRYLLLLIVSVYERVLLETVQHYGNNYDRESIYIPPAAHCEFANVL